MTEAKQDLNALIGSRICHDLISPLGAIANGVELLGMSGVPMSPEISLIAESVENANARIRFFRIGFGAASPDQAIALREIQSVLADVSKGGKTRINWGVEGDLPRAEVKMAFLAIHCLETALARGGEITISRMNGQWCARAEAELLRVDAGLWAMLDASAPPCELRAAEVQFALLPETAARLGRAVRWEQSDGAIEIRF